MPSITPSAPEGAASLPTPIARLLVFPSTHVLMGVAILGLDYVTGPYLLFPILFVVPVTLAAWFYSARWGLGLAVILPLGRLIIAEFVDRPSPLGYMIVNSAVRILVLTFLAYLVARTAEQTRTLQAKVSGFVTMCAWSRIVEHQGEWISFEEYLTRRFGIHTSHGLSPDEAEKFRARLDEARRDP